MRIAIAAYVTMAKQEGSTVYVCRPLVESQPEVRDPLLRIALQRLANKSRQVFHQWIEAGHADRVQRFLYDPDTITKKLKLHWCFAIGPSIGSCSSSYAKPLTLSWPLRRPFPIFGSESIRRPISNPGRAKSWPSGATIGWQIIPIRSCQTSMWQEIPGLNGRSRSDFDGTKEKEEQSLCSADGLFQDARGR